MEVQRSADIELFMKFLENKENEELKLEMQNALEDYETGKNFMFLRCLRTVAVDARTDVDFSQALCRIEAIGSDSKEELTYMAPIGGFFLTGCKILAGFLGDEPEIPLDNIQQRALQCLVQFLSSDHSALLKRPEKECKAGTATRYAEHLLMPLVAEKKYVIDTHLGLQSVKCCDVEHPISGMCGDTSFGLQDGWHGKVDILVNKSENAVPVVIEESTDDEASVSSVSSEEVKSDKYAQIIAQTFVFSFLQHKQNSGKVFNTLIPSIIISNEKFIVFMYDCEKDVLLGSCELNLFYKDDIDVRSIIVLWLVLNYRLFCSGLIDDFRSYQAEFHSLIGEEYVQKYRNEVTMPCHDSPSQKRSFDPSISDNPPPVKKRVNREKYPVIPALKIYDEANR